MYSQPPNTRGIGETGVLGVHIWDVKISGGIRGQLSERRYLWGSTVITNGTFKSVSYSLQCVLRDHVPPEAIVIPPITDQ